MLMILRVLRKDVDATGAAAGGGTALARDKYCPNRTESSNSGALEVLSPRSRVLREESDVSPGVPRPSFPTLPTFLALLL